MFRIGREVYARENGTFGLATLRRDHVHLRPGGKIVFDYVAKGNKERRLTVVDHSVHRTLSMLFRQDAQGSQVFSYLEDGWWVDVRSPDINDYIKEAFSAPYSAKDFRTWNATVIAAARIATHVPLPDSKAGQKRAITSTIAATAALLGNTPAVCRSSYIDPRVFERYEEGRTIAHALEQIPAAQWPLRAADRRIIEEAVIALLTDSAPDLTATLMKRLPSRARVAGARS
jgi:DNA topoisomerase IB